MGVACSELIALLHSTNTRTPGPIVGLDAHIVPCDDATWRADMKKRRNSLAIGKCVLVGSILLAIVAIAHRAHANASTFSWKMDKIHISGKANGRFHSLTAGQLSVEGQVEITE